MYSSAYHSSGAPSWVSRPSPGGGSPPGASGGAAGQPSPWLASGCPLVWGADGGGRRGGGSLLSLSGPLVLLPVGYRGMACRSWLRWASR